MPIVFFEFRFYNSYKKIMHLTDKQGLASFLKRIRKFMVLILKAQIGKIGSIVK